MEGRLQWLALLPCRPAFSQGLDARVIGQSTPHVPSTIEVSRSPWDLCMHRAQQHVRELAAASLSLWAPQPQHPDDQHCLLRPEDSWELWDC
jgi:hypothetical protein